MSAPTPAPAAAASDTLAQNPLMASYLRALSANPLRTKQLTAGILSALAEILAGWFAGVVPASSSSLSSSQSHKSSSGGLAADGIVGEVKRLLEKTGINERTVKMFVYGWAISAPMGHVLTGALQRAFAGRTTPRDRLLQILVSSLTVTVIQNVVYLSSMSIVNGARSLTAIQTVVRTGIWRMLQISWMTSPLCIAFAQKYLAPQLWEPFFTLVRFFLSTYFNTMAKKKQMAIARQAELKKRATSSQQQKQRTEKGGGAGQVADADLQKTAKEQQQQQ